ncbi:MAG: NADH-quinone oxidoreductase subunit C [Gammaproteobacteria bacterium]|nr:NADH-quinone oxidoreductase subunit C [Gammaproteobacteria bacterium]MCW8973506.1 NADH-quinone oxidoreductase subunit C [Gammaproteobacteria bacterium]MCW8992684.1 NADH-quinone oxidoreductase subunit C [Gammaproteobacteria bacterium]
MSDYYQQLASLVEERFSTRITATHVEFGELTVELPREHLRSVCTALRDEASFHFEQLIDLCGVDYLDYGNGVWSGPRFAVVYHLLSVKNNHRIRLRTFVGDEMPRVDSVLGIWNSADWYEREAFDLFGIVFEGHPDLRRILTDYGFIGHPFRKDFPLSGNVEMRYDPEQGRVIYQPVSIEPRMLVPRVIRDDNRYQEPAPEGES